MSVRSSLHRGQTIWEESELSHDSIEDSPTNEDAQGQFERAADNARYPQAAFFPAFQLANSDQLAE